MKKLLLLLLLSSIPVVGQKIDKGHVYQYSENVDYTIFELKKKKMISRGAGLKIINYVAPKGRKFVSILFQFENKSAVKQSLDFSQVFLKDSNGELHDVDVITMELKFTVTDKQLKQELKPNKKRFVAIEFSGTVDENEVLDTLVINGEEISLVYKE